MIPIVEHHPYVPIERVTGVDGSRHYKCIASGKPVPSVTTILDKTADKTSLLLWEKRVGKIEAERIRREAADLGTLMHTHMEHHVQGIERPRGNNLIRRMAERMADTIIAQGLTQVTEVWGMEVNLCFPTLYAGTTDLIGLYGKRPAIMDYKTARKLKTASMIPDYFCQMAAYAMAHDEVYGTRIRTGVIWMADREGKFREFVVEDREFERWKAHYLMRLEAYMNDREAERVESEERMRAGRAAGSHLRVVA